MRAERGRGGRGVCVRACASSLPGPASSPEPVHVIPSPTKPALQTQVKPPLVFVHAALESQLCGPALHSSLSTHVTPSPTKPALQAQVKPPLVFVHAALESQLCVPSVHSSTSSPEPVPPGPELGWGVGGAKTEVIRSIAQ